MRAILVVVAAAVVIAIAVTAATWWSMPAPAAPPTAAARHAVHARHERPVRPSTDAERQAATTALQASDPVRVHAAFAAAAAHGVHAAQADDPSVQARLDELVRLLQDPNNAARATPGADLLALPATAVPAMQQLLHDRPDLTWQARFALRRAVHSLTRPTLERLPDGLLPEAEHVVGRFLAGYRAGEDHDPRWDPLVERMFQVVAKLWTSDPERCGDEAWTVVALAHEARSRGCGDPLVCYFLGRYRELVDGTYTPLARDPISEASQGIDSSAYDQDLRSMVHLRGALFLWWGEDQHRDGPNAAALAKTMRSAAAELAASIAEAPIVSVPWRLDTYTDLLHHLHPEDPGAAIAGFLAQLRAAHPRHPVDAIAQAYFMQDWAWDARGSGWASEVTDEGWRLMHQRMAIARAGLDRAVASDPDYAPLYVTLLALANGMDASKSEVWSWFERLQELEPGETDAFSSLIEYLQPRWHGSQEEILQLGRAALATGDWADEFPIILQYAHNAINEPSGHEEDAAYLHRDEVWKDMDAVFGRMIAVYPPDDTARASYCFYAYAAGHLALARREYRLLAHQPTWPDETAPFITAALQGQGADPWASTAESNR